MRVWLDLANSPHVRVLEPVVNRLRSDGHEVLLTARDHAQTLELARARWPEVELVGDASPGGRLAKAGAIASRAAALGGFARRCRPDVALSHGSYAQLMAARATGVPAVTMMDYEHQPANHVSFRLARRVIVPEAFPADALRRCGARTRKVVRYEGFKEELYLSEFRADPQVLQELGLDASAVIAVLRPPPDGALYHRMANVGFDELVKAACAESGVQAVMLPRSNGQAERFRAMGARLFIPDRAVDAASLLALADLAIGGGGTMNRESALLGTPTYTVFAGRLAAVDAELIRLGRLHDLRDPGTRPVFEKKPPGKPDGSLQRAEAILGTVLSTLDAVARQPALKYSSTPATTAATCVSEIPGNSGSESDSRASLSVTGNAPAR